VSVICQSQQLVVAASVVALCMVYMMVGPAVTVPATCSTCGCYTWPIVYTSLGQLTLTATANA